MIEKKDKQTLQQQKHIRTAKNNGNNALKKSGYNYKIKYTELATENKDKKKEQKKKLYLVQSTLL